MFSNLALFKGLACPDRGSCSRSHCLYSHSPNVPQPRALILPVPSTSSLSPDKGKGLEKPKSSVVPAKRPAIASPAKGSPGPAEPPRKTQKVGPIQRPLAVSSAIQRAEVTTTPSSCLDQHSLLFSPALQFCE
jgi:RNA exonuclease 1